MSMNRRRFLAAAGLPALAFGALSAAGARALPRGDATPTAPSA